MKVKNKKIKERIDSLRQITEEHNRRYYIDNKPVISDFEFDLLMSELSSLEKNYPEFQSNNSPVAKVGSDLTQADRSQFVQTEHKYPMLSLGNTYEKEELYAFNERVTKLLGDGAEYVCELKIDGSAISLTYSEGSLIKSVTRGDGTKGDDITRNIRAIPSIPQKLSGNGYPEYFEIRGEIFMPWHSFNRLNQERFESEEELFANPRNAAAGSLKLLDSSVVSQRGLDSILYHLIAENIPFTTHYQVLKAAGDWGLPVSPFTKLCKSIDEVFEYLEKWDKKRKELPYPTDGVVIKVNSLEQQKKLGFTSKTPRWATAYKFMPERALTKVLSLDFQVGRTGAVTPVANLAPVLLSGTVVKRASLHNYDQIKLLDVHINDFVYVEKGGEIIPKIIEVELSKRVGDQREIVFPEYCPDCGTRLVRKEEEAKHYCPNSSGCPTQIKASLLHFTSRKAMDILAGEATIEQLYNLGFVKKASDFYTLTKENLLRLEGWKERSAERFLESLQKSKSTPFERVLYALGIRYIGETTARILARHFGNIDALISAKREDLIDVNEIGEILVNSVLEFFSISENRNLIEKLRSTGIRMEAETTTSSTVSLLSGMTFVVSGVFSVSRDELKEKIEKHGGKITSSVSSKTSFLVAGESPGDSKIKKAEELKIKIISEEDIEKMIQ